MPIPKPNCKLMYKLRSAQTLLEVLIAIAIIAIGLMAVIGFAVANSVLSEQAAEGTVATNLAREALEVVKQKRDSNWLQGSLTNFYDGLLLANGVTTAYPYLDTTSVTQAKWNLVFVSYSLSSDQAKIYLVNDVNTKRFVQSASTGGSATNYRRILTIQALCQASGQHGQNFAYTLAGTTCDAGSSIIGLQTTAVVSWHRPTGDKQVSMQTRLFNWR